MEFEAKVAQVGPREERAVCLEEIGSGATACSRRGEPRFDLACVAAGLRM